MKFQPDTVEGVNLVTRQERGRVWVGGTAFGHSVLVPWRGSVSAWPAAGAGDLKPAHFDAVAALKPEVVVFGSGERLRFVAPALMRTLIERGIGVETMDTAAACRTYNVLVSEGRLAVAALLIDTDPGIRGPAETL